MKKIPSQAPAGSSVANKRGQSRSAAVPLRSAPQEVRIIGGALRRLKLPVAHKAGLRPTPDRVRETLFNWLGQDLSMWRCVDVFAGSGALGFEAVSRGAAQVQLIEQDTQLVQSLMQTADRLKVSDRLLVRKGDGLTILSQYPAASMDLIFLDPPFDSDLLARAMPVAAKVIKPGGWLYLESAAALDPTQLAGVGLTVYRQLKAGQVVAQLVQRDLVAQP